MRRMHGKILPRRSGLKIKIFAEQSGALDPENTYSLIGELW